MPAVIWGCFLRDGGLTTGLSWCPRYICLKSRWASVAGQTMAWEERKPMFLLLEDDVLGLHMKEKDKKPRHTLETLACYKTRILDSMRVK